MMKAIPRGPELSHTSLIKDAVADITDPLPTKSQQYLVSSPYDFHPHLLDLSGLTTSQSFLAQALTIMKSTRSDYATANYSHSFNWTEVFDTLREKVIQQDYHWPAQRFYIVVFRSQIPKTTDRGHLGKLDEASHAEANKSGGLLKYWFGVPDAEGRNLATCIWRQQPDAKPGSAGHGHKEAVRCTRALYTEWHIERLAFEIDDDVKAWKMSDWVD